MSKNYGSVELYDVDSLEEKLNEAGYTTTANNDLKYCSAKAIWEEAKEYMNENATNEAEVRIDGLDYIEIYKI